MRTPVLLALALFLFLCAVHRADAQVHRCIGANGELAFTDQPCGAQEPSLGPMQSSASVVSAGPADTLATTTASGSRSLGTGGDCPRSPQALRAYIAFAFNGDDPNALAGLIDWRGYDRRSANARLREFQRWLKEPLAGIEFNGGAADPAGALPGDADYFAANPTDVTISTQPQGEDYISTRSFGVTRRGGCWWLSF